MPAYGPVRAISRGLHVLREISARGPVGATEIANVLKLPQATTVRIIETLITEGFVYRQGSTALFAVTAKTSVFAAGQDMKRQMVDACTPSVERLRELIGWPCNLGLFDNDAMIIAYTNREPNAFSVPHRFGARIPMLVTGLGLAYLAHMEPAKREILLEKLTRSPNTWDSNRRYWKNLDLQLQTVRRQGYALADEEYLDAIYRSKIWAIAVPILVGNKVRASLSALVLRSVASDRKTIAKLKKPLADMAAEMAGIMEFHFGHER